MLRVWPNRVRMFLAAEVAALLLVGAAVAPVAQAPAARAAVVRAAPPPPAWTALGDSYTAGPLIPNQIADPPGCFRSDHNYPHLAAAALGFTLTDTSCSGATVADMTAPQSTDAGTNPPQLLAVTPKDEVVTLGIAGNDIDFTGIVENCIAATPWGPTRVGRTCKAYYDPSGHDLIAAEIGALQPRVQATLAQIRARAPQAKIFVVGYPAILPAAGFGCWPQMPLTVTDVPYLRLKELELNAMLAAAAAAAQATFIDTYVPSESHNACTPESVRWVEPVVPGAMAFPVHPNAAGEAGVAKVVQGAVAEALHPRSRSSSP
jgi:GDSL-like Lipase/Acylhydrolase family